MEPIEFAHPWQNGPAELILYALEHLHKASDFDQRIAFLLLDIGVETACKTFLELPKEITGTQIGFGKRKAAAEGNFHEVIHGVQESCGNRLDGIDLMHLVFYHNIRNKLYHQGNGITVPTEKTKAYAHIAVQILNRLLEVDLVDHLIPPNQRPRAFDELYTKLEGIQVTIQLELKRYKRALPLLVEKTEPILLLPSVGIKFYKWAVKARVPHMAGDAYQVREQFSSWVDGTIISMPTSLHELSAKYLGNNELDLIDEHYYEDAITTIALQSNLYHLISFARQLHRHEIEDSNFSLEEAGKAIGETVLFPIVVETRYEGLSDLRDGIRFINSFASGPVFHFEEDEFQSLQGWLELRQEALGKIKTINETMSKHLNNTDHDIE